MNWLYFWKICENWNKLMKNSMLEKNIYQILYHYSTKSEQKTKFHKSHVFVLIIVTLHLYRNFRSLFYDSQFPAFLHLTTILLCSRIVAHKTCFVESRKVEVSWNRDANDDSLRLLFISLCFCESATLLLKKFCSKRVQLLYT